MLQVLENVPFSGLHQFQFSLFNSKINNVTLYVVQVLMDLNTGRKQKLNGGNASTEVVALILIEWF